MHPALSQPAALARMARDMWKLNYGKPLPLDAPKGA